MRSRRVIVMALGLSAFFGVADATTAPSLQYQRVVSAVRFHVLETFRGEAALDITTQLIWERTPSQTEVTWATAGTRCALKTVGGHTGWRLPSFFELMTLVDPSLQDQAATPQLPAGHPFQGVKADVYWAVNSPASESAEAFAVDFARGDVSSHRKTQAHPLWCVRGGITDPPHQHRQRDRQDSV